MAPIGTALSKLGIHNAGEQELGVVFLFRLLRDPATLLLKQAAQGGGLCLATGCQIGFDLGAACVRPAMQFAVQTLGIIGSSCGEPLPNLFRHGARIAEGGLQLCDCGVFAAEPERTERGMRTAMGSFLPDGCHR